MNKTQKWVVAILAALVLILLVFGIGDSLTGYAVHGFEKDLDSFPHPFIKNGAYNNLFLVVPDDYSSMDLTTANRFATDLQGDGLFGPRIVQFSEVPDGKHNLIMIGNLNNFNEILYLLDADEYNKDGVIKLIPSMDATYLIISGNSDQGVYRASRLVLDNNLEGSEFTF
jgi:hypothetical protein